MTLKKGEIETLYSLPFILNSLSKLLYLTINIKQTHTLIATLLIINFLMYLLMHAHIQHYFFAFQ